MSFFSFSKGADYLVFFFFVLFYPLCILQYISHTLILFILRLPLSPSVLPPCFPFLASVSAGPKEPTWGRSICCQCLSFAYPSAPPFSLSPGSQRFFSDSHLPPSSSVPTVSVPSPNPPPTPLPLRRSHAPMGAGGRGWRFALIAAWLQAFPGQGSCGASVCWM